jgi:hypothetical protein
MNEFDSPLITLSNLYLAQNKNPVCNFLQTGFLKRKGFFT